MTAPTPLGPAAWQVRPLVGDDPDAVFDVYRRAFDAAGRPWTRRDLEELMGGAGAFGFTLQWECRRCGVILARQIADEAEILTLAVLPDWRRRGGARKLLCSTLDRARDLGVCRIFLEVASDNLPAIRLYAGSDFTQVGLRKRYYSGNNGPPVDALVLCHDFRE